MLSRSTKLERLAKDFAHEPRHSYPSNVNTTTHGNALQQVSSARVRLSHATEYYLAACQFLASACVTQPQSSDQLSHELALSAIDAELSTLQEDEGRVQKAHIVLIHARNRAKMTAPIYSLPAETLTRIFLGAACHHAHDESKHPVCLPSNPVTLSAVCRLWRNVAINSRSLWTHLDILIGGTNRQPRYPSSQLWISRSQKTPLRIHIRLCSSTLLRRPDNAGHPTHPNDLGDSDDSDSSDSSDVSDVSDDSDDSRDSSNSGDSSDSNGSDDSGTSDGDATPCCMRCTFAVKLDQFFDPTHVTR